MSTAPTDPQPTPEASRPLLAYASPVPLARIGDLLRKGDLLLVRNGTTLPPHCILCGKEGWRSPVLLKFTWDASFRVTHQSTLQLRQQGSIRAYLCVNHRGRYQSGRMIGITGILLSLALMVAGLTVGILSESSDVPRYTSLGIGLTLTGFALMILSLFDFTLRTRTLTCTRIEEEYLHLEGADKAFLHPIPFARAGV